MVNDPANKRLNKERRKQRTVLYTWSLGVKKNSGVIRNEGHLEKHSNSLRNNDNRRENTDRLYTDNNGEHRISQRVTEGSFGRNFRFKEGILAIVDGSKGLRKAIEETFGEFALVQRCQWHKRENVVSYLKEEEKDVIRGKLQRAYGEPCYEEAKSRLYEIADELKIINRSAARSLQEGLEATLTMHRLGLVEEFGRSFTTTNLIENLNSQLRKYIGRVKYWMNTDMKSRWIAGSLLEIEKRMRRVNNYQKLSLLRAAIKSELKLKQQKVA